MREVSRGSLSARLARIRSLSSELLQFLGWKCCKDRRQFDPENRSALLPVVAKNFPIVFLNNSKTDAQPQACAFADRLGGVKRIENAMRLFNARASIGKQDDHVAAIAHRFDGQHAAFMRFHGINGIADEIEKHLHELIAISAHSRKNGFELLLDACRRGAKIEGAKLSGIGHNGVDIKKSALGRNLACKAKQITDQRFCPAS